jgi:hypothetical protein
MTTSRRLRSATATSSADIQTRQAFAIRFLREVALRPHHSSAFGYTTLRPSGTIGLWARPAPPHHLGTSIGQAFHPPALRVPLPPLCPSNYRVCKPQANKCPLEPNTKQAPAQTSQQAKHNLSHVSPPSSFLHPRSSTRSSYSSCVVGMWRKASWRSRVMSIAPGP